MNPSRTRNWQENDGEAQQPPKAHRYPRDVLWCSRKLQGIGYTKKTASD